MFTASATSHPSILSSRCASMYEIERLSASVHSMWYLRKVSYCSEDIIVWKRIPVISWLFLSEISFFFSNIILQCSEHFLRFNRLCYVRIHSCFFGSTDAFLKSICCHGNDRYFCSVGMF